MTPDQILYFSALAKELLIISAWFGGAAAIWILVCVIGHQLEKRNG